jgi:hypothetical protein
VERTQAWTMDKVPYPKRCADWWKSGTTMRPWFEPYASGITRLRKGGDKCPMSMRDPFPSAVVGAARRAWTTPSSRAACSSTTSASTGRRSRSPTGDKTGDAGAWLRNFPRGGRPGQPFDSVGSLGRGAQECPRQRNDV